MHHIEIQYGSGRIIRRSLPSSWDEVPKASRWTLLHAIITGQTSVDTLRQLLRLPGVIEQCVEDAQWFDLIRVIDWMYADAPLDEPILPYIIAGGVKIYFPDVDFKDVTGREYALLDDLMMEDDEEDRMLAILCRPTSRGRPEHDLRIPLMAASEVEAWLPQIRLIPEEIRLYLHAIFSGYRLKLYQSYRDWLFPTPSPLSDGEDTKTGDGLNLGWWGAFLSIAEDGVFGTYEQVLQTPIHTICMYLMTKEEQARTLREQHDHAVAQSKFRS